MLCFSMIIKFKIIKYLNSTKKPNVLYDTPLKSCLALKNSIKKIS